MRLEGRNRRADILNDNYMLIKDVVDIILFFVENESVNGIFNVGTGTATTWNQLANALFSSVEKKADIEYIDMPEVLKEKYQYFTQADMTKLTEAGYTKPFYHLHEAVSDYVQYLERNQYL